MNVHLGLLSSCSSVRRHFGHAESADRQGHGSADHRRRRLFLVLQLHLSFSHMTLEQIPQHTTIEVTAVRT